MKILLAEDADPSSSAISALLSETYNGDLDVTFVRTKDAVLEALRATEYDVVILDYVLPDGNAAELLEEVGALGLSSPFVVVSAVNEGNIDIYAIQTGADDFIIKDELNPAVLKRSIEHAVYRKERFNRLAVMAYYDALTGLPNRSYVDQYITKIVEMSLRADKFLGVLYIDLNKFKPINDTYGHATGDEVLKEIAARLKTAIRKTDAAVRVGGDEFLILAPGMAKPDDISGVSTKIKTAICEPMLIDGKTLEVGASLGHAVIPGDVKTVEEAIDLADKRMYQEKHER